MYRMLYSFGRERIGDSDLGKHDLKSRAPKPKLEKLNLNPFPPWPIIVSRGPCQACQANQDFWKAQVRASRPRLLKLAPSDVEMPVWSSLVSVSRWAVSDYIHITCV